MPFSEPTPFIINVTTADIAAASNTTATTSLAIALKRMNDARQLPGQEAEENVSPNQFNTQLNPRLMNGQLVNVIDVFCISIVYSLDANSTLIILSELLGVKVPMAYTATMVHA